MINNTKLTAKSIKTNESNYMIQLDALRALAVFSVLIHHYLHKPLLTLGINVNIGGLGVRLFFVLSGFLITRILLQCRDLIDVNQQNIWFTIKRFYIRRFIRLVPIYLLTIFAMLILAFELIKEPLIWHLTYTSNIYFSLKDWDELTAHFWSLSVEEQFYLIWPWFIILTPKKHLLKLIFITTLTGPLFRLLLIVLNLDNGTREYILTFACLDSLGIGAILAFYTQHQSQLKLAKKYLCDFSFWFALPLFIVINFTDLIPINVSTVVGCTFTSIFFMGLIGLAAQGFKGLIGNVLELRLLVYLGRISYGIYVYHLLVPYIIYKTFNRFGFTYPSQIWINFALYTLGTLIVAVFSWHFFEKPINDFKRYFGYKEEGLSAH